MIHSTFNFEWNNSSAHLLLLSKFRSTNDTVQFTQSDSWSEALKESPKIAIKHFIRDGVLEKAKLSGALGYRYNISKLKSMLRQRGLKLTGRKAELIERLIQSDPEGMEEIMSDVINGLTLLQCTKKGQRLVEKYLGLEKEKRIKAEEKTLLALQEHKLKKANQIVNAFDAQQVFPSYPTDYIIMLKILFKAIPNILGLNDEQMEHLRIAVGMNFLWGASIEEYWSPSNFKTQLPMNKDYVIDVFTSLYYYIYDRQEDLSYFIEIVDDPAWDHRKFRVENKNALLVCKECRKLARKRFELNQIPELPYKSCTSKKGCFCMINFCN